MQFSAVRTMLQANPQAAVVASLSFAILLLTWMHWRNASRTSKLSFTARAAGLRTNPEIIPPDIKERAPIDLTTIGARVPKDAVNDLYANFDNITSANVTPEFNRKWTNETIGYEFRSLWRQIEMMKRDGALK